MIILGGRGIRPLKWPGHKEENFFFLFCSFPKVLVVLSFSVVDPFHFDLDPDPDPRFRFLK